MGQERRPRTPDRTPGPYMVAGRYIVANNGTGDPVIVATTTIPRTDRRDPRSIAIQEADAAHLVECANACDRFNPAAIAELVKTADAIRSRIRGAVAEVPEGVTFTMDDDLRALSTAAMQIDALAELLTKAGV